MVININQSRINVAGNPASKALDRRRQQETAGPSAVPTPARAHVNIIPSVESLATLIRGAVAALRQGARWDRGTILNLLV